MKYIVRIYTCDGWAYLTRNRPIQENPNWSCIGTDGMRFRLETAKKLAKQSVDNYIAKLGQPYCGHTWRGQVIPETSSGLLGDVLPDFDNPVFDYAEYFF